MNIEHFYSTYFTAGKISIDSRKIKHNDVFFAFSGEQFNAAIFAENAIEQGAKAVIVEDENYAQSDKNIFYVSSTLKFLQELAFFFFSCFGFASPKTIEYPYNCSNRK